MKTYDQVFKVIKEKNIKYIALRAEGFTSRSHFLWVPVLELQTAVEKGISIDGGPLGFAKVNKSDVVLKADLDSFMILPWDREGNSVAGVVCDLYYPDTREEIKEYPRCILKRAIRKLKEVIGEEVNFYVAPEPEFFFLTRIDGKLTLHDKGTYFSPPPIDKGYKIREELCDVFEKMGLKVVKSHHEMPPAKHEINIQYDQASRMADKLYFYKLMVKKLVDEEGLIATCMPKPFDWTYGAGWHTHLSLLNERTEANLFYSPKSEHGLSDLCLYFINGILTHAKALAAITNPTVNSYKRLVPGKEAPVYLTWSKYNRSALLRIPSSLPEGTRIEYRPTDGSCNFYLAFAALLYAGLDGIARKKTLPQVEEDLADFTEKEKLERGIEVLPSNLGEALKELEQDEVIKNAISPLTQKYIEAKRKEWHEYSTKVFDWERERYLDV